MMLKEIQKPIIDYLNGSNELLKKWIGKTSALIKKMHSLTPFDKGKKIRSTLFFHMAGMNAIFYPGLSGIAASIEMLHLSSLIHDDVVDNSEFRRGQKTLKYNLGNHLSVLWGDYLFLNSLNMLNKYQEEILHSILKAATDMIEGQILEEENKRNFSLDYDTYLRVINKKTSSLFTTVCRIIALLGKRDVDEFSRFGENFGNIFQISDDMIDIFSRSSGKDRFRDIKEGKVTLPLILLREESRQDIAVFYNQEIREDLLKLLRSYRIKSLCRDRIEFFYRKCREFLDSFPASKYKESLIKLLDFVKYRDY